MYGSFKVIGSFSGSTSRGTSTSDILSAATYTYGSGSTTYNNITTHLSILTHFCETIIVHNSTKNYLDSSYNNNCYDKEIMDFTVSGQTGYDWCVDCLKDMDIIESNGNDWKFTNKVTGNSYEEKYDLETATYDKCNIGKCFAIQHVEQILNISCVCGDNCDKFDNITLPNILC